MTVNERAESIGLRPVEAIAEAPKQSSLREALRERVERLRFHSREVVALAVLGMLVLAGATVAYVRARPVSAATMAPLSAPGEEPATSAESSSVIVVHVVGAVRKPGVYELREGARVVEAVRAAGGLTRSADAPSVNLARALSDGEQVVVPKRGEGASSATVAGGSSTGGAAPGAAGGTVNINQAGASELDGLPGIGPVLAERIVAYRDQHGPFKSVRDLMKVSGIGPKKFESLEASVTV